MSLESKNCHTQSIQYFVRLPKATNEEGGLLPTEQPKQQDQKQCLIAEKEAIGWVGKVLQEYITGVKTKLF